MPATNATAEKHNPVIERINAARTIDLERYREDGCDDRVEYFRQLADEHGIALDTVIMLSDLLGPDEDFDGLVTSCEDAEAFGGL